MKSSRRILALPALSSSISGPGVWIDLDNSPHVLFFAPIIRELEDAGVNVFITAKPHAQTLQLAQMHGLRAIPVGRANPRAWIRKVVSTLGRTGALWSRVRKAPPSLLFLSHGSRSGSLAARVLSVPVWTFLDYEHVELRSLSAATSQFWMPDLLRTAQLPNRILARVRFYPGLKENMYLADMGGRPDHVRAEYGIAPSDRWVITRPPATTAHYRSPLSLALWKASVDRLLQRPEVQVHVLPRDAGQSAWIRSDYSAVQRLTVIDRPVDGPQLIGAADLVVGGGGTMNREAAVLGTPVWSVFSGPVPHIDSRLADEGRLEWIRNENDLDIAERRLWWRPTPRGGGPEGRAMIVQSIRAALVGGRSYSAA